MKRTVSRSSGYDGSVSASLAPKKRTYKIVLCSALESGASRIFNGAGSTPRPRWSSSGRSLHFLTDPLEVEALRQDRRFSASPHHGHRGWMALRLDARDVDWDEVAELLESAYRQVVPRSSMTK